MTFDLDDSEAEKLFCMAIGTAFATLAKEQDL